MDITLASEEKTEKNKLFFDRMSERNLYECVTEKDFIAAYEEIQRYEADNTVSKADREYYWESGASEFLMMHTIDYRH